MQKVYHKETGAEIVRGSTIRVPYHGFISVDSVKVYAPGEWANFSKTNEYCAVFTYSEGEDVLAENIAFSVSLLDEIGLEIR